MPNDRRWTDEQRAAIRAGGSGVLVSAAAGSGKTSVLAERCAYLVCDAKDRCAVNELLVVTFTEAAAAEMKQRIESALRKRLESGSDDHLRKQLKLIEHANISTLHSFCYQLLRQNFHRAAVDPNVRVIDEDEATLMRAQAVRELFLEMYEAEDEAFARFIDDYGNGKDDRLMDLVVRTHDLMGSLVESNKWMDTARQRTRSAGELPMEQSDLGKAYCKMIERQVVDLTRKCQSARRGIPAGFDKYLQYIGELADTAEKWNATLRRGGYDALVEQVKTFKPERLPSYGNTVPGKDAAMAAVSGLKEQFTKGVLSQCLLFNSREWRDGMKSVSPHVETFLGLVSEFAKRYGLMKAAANGVDFADLERLALMLLRDDTHDGLHPSVVARTLQKRFRYVLVDEYQDINEVQDAILYLTSTECLKERESNLFCVGDVKQSIYRFRLAEPARFLEKESSFRDPSVSNRGRVIDLRENFRSRAPLLGAINAVFERLMTGETSEFEYDDTHRLRPGLEYPKSAQQAFPGAPIELHLVAAAGHTANADDAESDDYDRTELEAMLIARRIQQLMGLDGSPAMNVMERAGDDWVPRAIRYGDIVILLRAPKFKSRQMADILRAMDIPTHTDAGSGYFQAVEVRDMLALLSLLDNQQQDVPLAAVLRSPLAALPKAEDALARIRLAPQSDVPFHRAAVAYANSAGDELAAQLKSFFAQLARWREIAHQRPLAEVIWTIYEQTGYLAFVSGLDDGEQRVANLLHLHERARQFGSFSRQGLYRFMQFLESLQEEKETARPAISSGADDAVRIMSVHGSKGLEFPMVFVADLGKKHNLGDSRGSILVDRKEFVGMEVVDQKKQIRYPSLGHVMVQERLKRQSLAEELRLLYVAMTRAREHLVLVGSCDDKQVQRWENWRGHAGAMPADDVLAGTTMLDWVGPVAFMEEGKGTLEIHRYSEDETRAWSAEDIKRPKFSDEQMKLSRLEELTPPPPIDTRSAEIIASLSYQYPHETFTHIAAARSVTQWTKQGKPAPSMETEVESAFEKPAGLKEPRCIAADLKPLAADVGSTTHLVLEYLDFHRPADERDVAEQINELVTRRLISARQARAVDVEGIVWVLKSPIGELVRKHDGRVRREMPFYLAAKPEQFDAGATSSDPSDQVMVRGRMDVVIETDAGLVIADYKTDRLAKDDVDTRAEFYRDQVRIYREAAERISGIKVAKTHLLFLSPQIVKDM